MGAKGGWSELRAVICTHSVSPRAILGHAMFTDLFSCFLATARQAMVDSQLRARGIGDQRILEAMGRVPRHEFVDGQYRNQAYEDHPLPIGEGQTISQPYIVAITLQALRLDPSSRVLEIGTGSGYQTALLAELAGHVYSLERRPALADKARGTLARLGYSNFTVTAADGSAGLPAEAPFDAIVVSAAAASVPPPLFEQLREGGRMVIPVGPGSAQELLLIAKQQGQSQVTRIEGCRFVPLVAGAESG
jgi:protein-L-isoaspartate(D-aspartate) O-methyltransferase